VHARDVHGRTALHWTAATGLEAVLVALVKHTQQPDVADAQGRAALHYAAENGKAKVRPYSGAKVANREIRVWHGATEHGPLNDGQISNPSNPFGIVPLSNSVPRGFGFVHHSIAILCHQVPNPNITIRFFFAVRAHGVLLNTSRGSSHRSFN
jgi:hypothetical protein